jgi:Zn-dependent protease with chaperone function
MRHVNGLFGWTEWNDRRTLGLFAAFIAAFHLLALPTLLFFLFLFDRAHAPILNWSGYAMRYGPILTLFGVGAFALSIVLALRAVRGALPFDPVARRQAPRLWRIFEPLAITAGLPNVRLAVMDSPALNAFAYGFARRNATVVVTRALIDALDDDELAAVLAHELTHIRRGDVRYLIAANACLFAIRALDRTNIDERKRASLEKHPLLLWLVEQKMLSHEQAVALRDGLGGIILVVLLPFLLLVMLTLLLLRRQLLNLADAIRLTLMSSREYIADAGAVESTKNPAALVSALQRISGRARIDGLPPEYAALLIEGEGRYRDSTHPPVSHRISAIAALTGSMAFIAPARRDTRSGAARGFGRRVPTLAMGEVSAPPPPVSLWSGYCRIAANRGRDVLGVGSAFGWGLLAALPAYLLVNYSQLDQPDKLLRAFDPRAGLAFAELATPTDPCLATFSSRSRSECRTAAEANAFRLESFRGQRNLMGLMAAISRGDTTRDIASRQ